MRPFDASVGVAVFGMFAVMVVTAAGYPQAARLVPLVVGVPALVLAGWQLWREWVAPGRRDTTTKAAGGAAQERLELSAMAWFVLFVLLIIGGGFTIGGTCAVTVGQRFWMRESWRTAVIGGAVAFLVLYVGIQEGLGFVLFEGLAARWLQI